MSTKFSVCGPDGRLFTRTSKNRIYTHAVTYTRDGGRQEVNFCGSLALAEKQAASLHHRQQIHGCINDISIRPVINETAMMERAAKALWHTFGAIGMDLIPNGKLVSRATLIDGITSCGYVGGYPESYGNDKEAIQWLDKQPEKVQRTVCRLAFPEKTYAY
jgi:hypothetical protein